MLKVINMFGGPGTGKSTLSAQLFAVMKKANYNVELVTEYAKDMVYEKRDNILADQLYILAKQNRRLQRLEGSGIEWAVTDGPLLLGRVYGKHLSESYLNLVSECHNRYENYNIWLHRNPHKMYHPEGRIQKTLEEAKKKDDEIITMFATRGVEVIPFQVGVDSAETLLFDIETVRTEWEMRQR